MIAAPPAPLLVGVDVVDVERVRRAIAHTGGVWVARVCAPAERAAAHGDGMLAAACVAVKECLVKAIGGRPAPFDWHDLTLDVGATRPVDAAHPLVLADLGPLAVDTLADVVGPAAGDLLTSPCAVHGPAREAALRRLYPTAQGDRPTPLRGFAVWATDGRRLVAAAVLHDVPITSGKASTP
jgi:holo-[acyl-carrier protein] synthase